MFAISTRIPSHTNQLRFDFANQLVLLFRVRDRNRTLQDVVWGEHISDDLIAGWKPLLTRVLVFHHGGNRAHTVLFRCHHFLYESTTTFRISCKESLLADVWSEFMARHVKHLPSKLCYDKRSIVLLPIFEDILHNIILQTSQWPAQHSDDFHRTPNWSCMRLIIYLWSSSMSGLVCSSPKCSKHLWRTRHPYGWVDSSKTLPLKAEMKLRRSAGTRSISFCTTWRHVRRRDGVKQRG